MTEIYIEDGFEKVFIGFIEKLGYRYIPHQEIVRDSMKSVVASEILLDSIYRINPSVSDEILEQATHKIKNIDAGLLVDRNEAFFEYLQNGLEISYYEDDEQRTQIVRILDFDNIENNSFVVTNQLTIKGRDTKRPDVIIYINGLPLVVIELKSMTSSSADIGNAFRQIKNYQYLD